MLKGTQINLRTVKRKDLEHYLELHSDIESRGQYFPLNLATESSVTSRFEKDGFWSDDAGTMLIVDKQTDLILGVMVFFKPMFYHDSVEIGYILFNTQDRGKGVVPEALRLFIKYIFDWKPINRIQLQIEPDNLSSQRVAEKCGFTLEGTARMAFISRGKAVNIDVFSLLREEFEMGENVKLNK